MGLSGSRERFRSAESVVTVRRSWPRGEGVQFGRFNNFLSSQNSVSIQFHNT